MFPKLSRRLEKKHSSILCHNLTLFFSDKLEKVAEFRIKIHYYRFRKSLDFYSEVNENDEKQCHNLTLFFSDKLEKVAEFIKKLLLQISKVIRLLL